MPGKAEVPLSVYFDAFAEGVRVFGRGQISTYILAGLGDTRSPSIHVLTFTVPSTYASIQNSGTVL